MLKNDKQVEILKALVEGNSIRSVERMAGVHRDTIMRLMIRSAAKCSTVLYAKLHDLIPASVQIDEAWQFVFKKHERTTLVERSRGEYGDQYTYIALDPESKLVIAHEVGRRNAATTYSFVHEVRRRIADGHIPQVTTDGFSPYEVAVPAAFGPSVDFVMLVKHYAGGDQEGERRYSPPRCTGVSTKVVSGEPDMKAASTSLVERHNLTMRMCLRRLTRLTNGFSKRLFNLKAAMALYVAHYNFCRPHLSLNGRTPAMAAGIADHVWSLAELIG